MEPTGLNRNLGWYCRVFFVRMFMVMVSVQFGTEVFLLSGKIALSWTALASLGVSVRGEMQECESRMQEPRDSSLQKS